MAEAQGINSVDIAVSILEFVAASGGVARAADIAKACDLSKSRLHKYLVSLCRSQMLYQDSETNRYCLGGKLLTLAAAARGERGYIAVINQALCEFRDKMNYSTGLAINVGDGLLLTCYNRSFRNVDIDYLDNIPLPLHASAAGLIYMTFGEKFRSAGLDEQMQEQIRRQGYAVRLTPTAGIPGAQAISCPVLSREGKLLAAAVTMGFMPPEEEEIQRLGEALKKKVATLKL